ncbi:MAG: PKD domain-containing protein [Bacteroidetes bacterium]|nr:MAG: PKD domain-containing protein [Bacteroidota bacterium]
MKTFASFLLCSILVLIGLVSSSQSLSEAYYDGQLWVQVNPSKTKGIAHSKDKVVLEPFIQLLGEELAQEFEVTSIRKPFHFAIDPAIREVYQVNFAQMARVEEFIRELEKLDVVNYAERVPIMRPTLTPNDLGPASGTNDQWGLHRIQAQQAWDITTGNTNIKVAIVDDAVLTTHPDLIPNLLPGYDVADNDNDAMPNTSDMSHGTHVAGIVSAATNNGIGVASIGFNVKLIPVKSSNSAQFVSDAYAGVVWAYQNDADVINMSWGGSGYSQTGQNIINNAYAAGCVNVAAAGNDNVSTVFYPAGYANVISVASTTTNDAKSSFSNFGSWVDISAPGSAIRSTYIGNNFSATYADLQGTSMASPMVAGLCGLVKSVNPQMTQTQIENCVLNTADNINSVNGSYIGQLGAGRINAYQAVLCAQTTLTTPPVAVIDVDNAVRCPGANIQFFGSSAGGLATTYSWSFPGGIPSASNAQNPVINYPALGTYNVSLTVSNQYGNDSETLNGFVEISTNGTDIFFNETFENGSLAQNQWTVVNPDNGITWDIYTVAGATEGSKAAGINLYAYNAAGQRDGLISPPLDFSGHSNIQLDFQHAHRRYSQDYSDSLIIYVSTDGGNTYPFRVFGQAETGQGTFATNSILQADFYPTNGIDWCFGGDLGSSCFTVDLSAFDGESNVRLRFETYNDYGNNIFIDNIQISGNCFFAPEPPVADFSASATNVCTGQLVQFTDESTNIPTSFQWSFPGGSPNASNSPSPTIVYNTPGTYAVSLTVSNDFGSDATTQSGFITVNASPSLQLNQTQVDLCSGESVQLVASGNGQSYTWSPATGLSSTNSATVTASPTSNTSYTITSSLNGCTSSATVDVAVNPNPAVPSVLSQNNLGVVITQPQPVEGYYNYQAPSAGWGFLPFANQYAEGDMIIARSSNGDSLMCGAAINAQQINGKIAVLYRGSCEFGVKALNAQNAGAIGVILVNNEPGDVTMDMGAGVSGPAVTIPVVMVSANVGAAINAAVNSGSARGVLGQFNGGGLTVCPEERFRLAAPQGYYAYEWSNGDQSGVGEFVGGGQYNVTVYNEFGCEASSASFSFNEYSVTTPVITENNGQLNANVSGASYQWYLNGEPISGSTAQIPIQGQGSYTVEVTDANGCITESDPYEVIFVGVEESSQGAVRLFPNPATDLLQIEFSGQPEYTQIEVYSADGRLISRLPITTAHIQTIETASLSAGTYYLRILGEGSAEQLRFTVQ